MDTKTKTANSAPESKDQPSSADGNETSLNSSFNGEIENLISDVQELHDLDEEAWSLRKYHYSPKGTTCRGAYNSERNMIRIKGAVEAPLERVLSYILEPPYGYRKDSQSSYRVIEKLGSGASLIYKEKPEQTVCCFRIAPRDGVYLAVLRILTSETAIFAMRTVQHSSHPPSQDGYRVSVPLIGFYVKQEGDLTAVEYYFAETDLGGKLGKAGPGKSIEDNVNHMIRLSQSIPKVKDGVPPYQQLL
ncbi:hypothetical protein HOLleu_17795 [Holothuria leucospilota]|uniref:START domain-containing protein n=1 Tax=Holothuria leucospilota TaxID=206669 RepID=A0A9Q1C1V3_HOLLE|nr:hypothetical protein HOLleu_17795 [Holothuria leucospilota]